MHNERTVLSLCCCWRYIKFQITITVCRFHWEQEIFRGLLQWMEWILMPIISRYFNNISNIVDHWYLSFKLTQSNKSLWFLNMTPLWSIKCSTPGLRQRGSILRLGKAWLEFCYDKGVGEIREGHVRGDWSWTYRQLAWLDLNQDSGFIFMRERVWFLGKLSLISFTSHFAQRRS